MGHELYRMIRDGAPPGWTSAMRNVAMVIADDARDPSQGPPEDGGWPRSAIPVCGYWTRDGQWRDGIAERTGLSERAISRVLAALARAGYEMRHQAGTDRRGRPLFAYPGHAMRFRVPILPPRKPTPQATAGTEPDMATISPPKPATISPPKLATFDAGDPEPAKTGDHMPAKTGTRPPKLASKVTTFGGPLSPVPSPDTQIQVVNSYLEGARTREDDDHDHADSALAAADRPAAQSRPARLVTGWDEPFGPGYGQCPDCGLWVSVNSGGGRLVRHRGPGYGQECPGSRGRPAEPVHCTACGRTGIALQRGGRCASCRRNHWRTPADVPPGYYTADSP